VNCESGGDGKEDRGGRKLKIRTRVAQTQGVPIRWRVDVRKLGVLRFLTREESFKTGHPVIRKEKGEVLNNVKEERSP